MLIRDIAREELAGALRRDRFYLDTGAFVVRLRADGKELAATLGEAYADYPFETAPVIHDFQVAIGRAPGRFGLPIGRQSVRASINGGPAFDAFPAAFAFPMLESTVNWCIAQHVLRYVTFHAGAVERKGRAVILTGPSGAGKSTLCAALSQREWRLLSDELVLLRPRSAEVVANPRPISLKNEAIERIARLSPAARFSPGYKGTVKGTISFLYPRGEAVARAKEGARPAIVIRPSFEPHAVPAVRELGKAEGFMMLVENSVNYFSTLRKGFETLSHAADLCRFYELTYRDLDEAVETIARLHGACIAGEAAA